MADAAANFAYSTVATAPSPASSGTSLVVQAADGAKFPAAPFNVTIWPAGSQPSTANAEIARCTAVSTDTLTIVRAQEATAARTVVVGDQIAETVTAGTISSLLPFYITGADRIINDATQEYVDGFYEIGSGFVTELAGTTSQLVVATSDEGSTSNLTMTGPGNFGIDFNTGSFTTGAIRLKNNTSIYGRNAAGTADVPMIGINASNEVVLSTFAGGNVAISGGVVVRCAENVNFQLGTVTGTALGTGATQKLSFWGAVAIVQPLSTVDHDTVLINTGLKASGGKTPYSNTFVTTMDETINTDRQVIIEDYYEIGSGFMTELAGTNSLLSFVPVGAPWVVSGADASGSYVELLKVG